MIPYTPYTSRLQARGFGNVKVRKITLNGGFTCPNLDGTKGHGGCIFCDNRGFSPAANQRNVSIAEQMRKEMEFQRTHFQAEKFIAYYQPFSGTYASISRLRDLYEQALDHPDVVGLSIGTRPDCISDEVVDLLEEIASKTFLTLELGLQSSFDSSLKHINRGHTFLEFSEAMERCQNRSFDLCVHVILGLPGEFTTHYKTTAQALNQWNYQSLKIHPLHVVKGTVLAEQYQRGEYSVLTLEEYTEGVVDFLEYVPAQVGLQRFTGDATGELLLAPLWCHEKNKVRTAFLKEFKKRGSWQGSQIQSSVNYSDGLNKSNGIKPYYPVPRYG